MVDIYNSLPQHVVDNSSVSEFQSYLNPITHTRCQQGGVGEEGQQRDGKTIFKHSSLQAVPSGKLVLRTETCGMHWSRVVWNFQKNRLQHRLETWDQLPSQG